MSVCQLYTCLVALQLQHSVEWCLLTRPHCHSTTQSHTDHWSIRAIHTTDRPTSRTRLGSPCRDFNQILQLSVLHTSWVTDSQAVLELPEGRGCWGGSTSSGSSYRLIPTPLWGRVETQSESQLVDTVSCTDNSRYNISLARCQHLTHSSSTERITDHTHEQLLHSQFYSTEWPAKTIDKQRS